MTGGILHFGDLRNFARLAGRAKPLWLIGALLLQLSTYVSLAAGWQAVLRESGNPMRLPPLLRIAITKLFADQAIPSAGMGGNVILVDQLVGRGVNRSVAVAALLISMIGFYSAYLLFAIVTLLLLWMYGKATAVVVVVLTTFMAVAIAIPTLALLLRHRGRRPLPDHLARIGVVRKLLETVGQAPTRLLKNRALLVKVSLFNALVFLADTATLETCLRAFGEDVPFATAFIALIMASVAVTLAPLPFGLGSFEFVCVGTLRLLGVAIEPAFAGAMLLRLFTTWVPLVPGLFFIRKTMLHRRCSPSP